MSAKCGLCKQRLKSKGCGNRCSKKLVGTAGLSGPPASHIHKAGKTGRSGEIRTPDPLLPKQVRYQAALHSVSLKVTYIDKRLRPRNRGLAMRAPRGGSDLEIASGAGDIMSAGAAPSIAAKEASGYGPPRFVARIAPGREPAPARVLQRRRLCIGAWPSGKATGFGPVIPGSNPGAPATLVEGFPALSRHSPKRREQPRNCATNCRYFSLT